MSEKYFISFIIIAFGISLILPLVYLLLQMRLKHLQKLVCLRVLKRQQKSEYTALFSTLILNDCCKNLFYRTDKRAHRVLAYLAVGKVQKAAEFFRLSDPLFSLLLDAHCNAGNAYKKISKQKNQWYVNKKYGVFLPVIAYILFDNHAMHTAITKINPQKLSNGRLAYYNYCIAASYLYDGDMLSASQKASAALDYFRKKRYFYETSMCYLLLGEIYRLSCVNDVAQTMIEAAIKINCEQKLPQMHSKSIVSLGMLMLFENRLDEAEDKFNQALSMAQTENLRADIHNQKALLYLAQNKHKEAEKEITTALKAFAVLKNIHGQAFSLQLSAQIAFGKKQYHKALKHASEAIIAYEQSDNTSAILECLYLSADVLFRQNKVKKSEELLRRIIKKDENTKHNFHVANAYSLLGLIYLRKNELQRAKVLLQQSLHLEQRHRRCEGMVSDYTNLALIDNLSGNREAAKGNMQTALNYALETGNDELVALIKKKLAQV